MKVGLLLGWMQLYLFAAKLTLHSSPEKSAAPGMVNNIVLLPHRPSFVFIHTLYSILILLPGTH